MIVLVLLGFVAVLSVPALSKTLKGLKLRSAVQDMAGAMRHVREKAILEQRPQWLAFDVENDLYWAGRGDPEETALAGPEDLLLVKLPSEVDLSGFKWINGKKAHDQGWFTFFPNGSASGGAVLLATREGGKTTEISLNPFTGLTTVTKRSSDAE